MDKNKNVVIAQAWKDYNPKIVEIVEDKIKQFKITDEIRAVTAGAELDALKYRPIKESIAYLMGLNSINYQYWDVIDGKFIRYQNNGLVGALASFEAFGKLHDFMTKNSFNINLINVDLISQFYGDIPDKENRVNILRESLNPVKFLKVCNLVEEYAKKSKINVELAEKISKILPKSYDEPYLKKIQLALYAIAQLYQYQGVNVECEITVPVDYQIPKVLEAEGILKYSKELKNKIQNFEMIAANGLEEKALRAATTIACEYIAELHNISIPALDRYLWLIRNNYPDRNFHLTKTTAY